MYESKAKESTFIFYSHIITIVLNIFEKFAMLSGYLKSSGDASWHQSTSIRYKFEWTNLANHMT